MAHRWRRKWSWYTMPVVRCWLRQRRHLANLFKPTPAAALQAAIMKTNCDRRCVNIETWCAALYCVVLCCDVMCCIVLRYASCTSKLSGRKLLTFSRQNLSPFWRERPTQFIRCRVKVSELHAFIKKHTEGTFPPPALLLPRESSRNIDEHETHLCNWY